MFDEADAWKAFANEVGTLIVWHSIEIRVCP